MHSAAKKLSSAGAVDLLPRFRGTSRPTTAWADGYCHACKTLVWQQALLWSLDMIDLAAKLAQLLLRCRPGRLGWGLVMGAGIAIAGCRPTVLPPTDSVAPTPPTATAPTPAPTAPTTTPGTAPATATLPDALIHEWQPLSNVLLAFGTMAITPNQVEWSSGQRSPYTLVSTEGGYLLRLESSPSFYDTQNQYIRLMPKANATGAATSLEIAFFPSEAQLQRDEYVMYGSYFAE